MMGAAWLKSERGGVVDEIVSVKARSDSIDSERGNLMWYDAPRRATLIAGHGNRRTGQWGPCYFGRRVPLAVALDRQCLEA